MNMDRLIQALSDIMTARYGMTVTAKPGRG